MLNGGVTINNCKNFGFVEAKDETINYEERATTNSVGILNSITPEETSEINISNCSNEGIISNGYGYGECTATGVAIAGAIDVNVSNCSNNGEIKAEETRNIIGVVDATGENVKITDCKNSMDLIQNDGSKLAAVASVGGIAYYDYPANIVCERLENTGKIESDNTVGSEGYVSGCIYAENYTSLEIKNCKNSAEIRINDTLGCVSGILCIDASTPGGGNALDKVTIVECINDGAIIAQECYAAGGIVASQRWGSLPKIIEIIDCSNNANILGSHSAGIMSIENAGDIILNNCTNIGVIEGENCAGILMIYYSSDYSETNKMTATDCKNSGNIIVTSSESQVGGLFVENTINKTVTNCENTGTITKP